MKPRISLGLFLITLIGLWFVATAETRTPLQVFPAVIDRDCAPWDGSAFTVSIPLRDGSGMAISIYRSPEIRLPTSFSFPDETMSEGNALLLLATGISEPLTGRVWLQSVQQGIPVEGRFQLRSEAGMRWEGRFVAEWGDEIVYCG